MTVSTTRQAADTTPNRNVQWLGAARCRQTSTSRALLRRRRPRSALSADIEGTGPHERVPRMLHRPEGDASSTCLRPMACSATPGMGNVRVTAPAVTAIRS